jgi:hypothetical protein
VLHCFQEKLGRAALTVAVLVFLFIVGLTLTAFFRLLLAGLTALLVLPAVLPLLTGLTTLLFLSGLTTLLTLFFHIVCHDYSS